MSQATRILLALVAGLALGIVAAGQGFAPIGILIAQPIGTAWLNGLQMTIVPLVVSLLVIGIAATADAARAGQLAGRAMILFMVLLWSGAIMAAFVTPVLLDLWPIDPVAGAALKASLSNVGPVGKVPPFGDFLAAIVPNNPVSAAANNAFLPLIVFTLAFAFAITRLAAEQRDLLVAFFRAVADAMIVVIGWVLWLGPIGVGALAFLVGAKAGGEAFGALLHYVLIVTGVGTVLWIFSFFLGAIGGRVSIVAFARATASAQAVAISTQSSLASLPAMLRGAGQIGVHTRHSGIILPLAVAVFRATGPAMNLAVAIYIAMLFGVPLTWQNLAAGVAVASITTLGAVSLPGSITFVSSIAPIAAAMGVPIAPLGLLVAIETFPDIMRTLGNVTMDLAVTATLSARAAPVPVTPEDLLIAAPDA
ncbi:dicarboxylate/amino acid:cation symporter [Sphingomonas sp. 28-63-12]|uniref:dicarboxylate/amino acid:cation symporter n=1 Tax=Sphingomonas sp. 28-63-12 TaxID=1970434 RepID=UPI000BD231A8|nr:MAG: sodium:dicarboxylate symporter [Sphingomonas sp. 28-63-12]